MTQSDAEWQAIAAYVDQMATMIELPIPPECREGVIANVMRTKAIAQLFLDFPVPDEVEIAPTFDP
ncbi:DUF4089 domain-containing protein [Vacuolonema iberomarrocanum]|uniref:DUF4089 domain-containing protein n=1 Tax=Vacuolonema iberomarrocanum TaxID=3454632 RepID=UPI001A033210|nr:DUF4089 domain-containing protein [filamentous cyanobacterium LEGE 07170]